MSRYSKFELPCLECEPNDNGFIYIGNLGAGDPSTHRETCLVCGGSQFVSVSDQDYYDHAVKAMKEARERFHRFKYSLPKRSEVARVASLKWLVEAKKARSAIVESLHAGAAHLVHS